MKNKIILFFSSIVLVLFSLTITGCSMRQIGWGLGGLERTGRY